MMSNDSCTKNRFRFNEQLDLHLLREVYGQNPYEERRRWSVIQINFLQITGKSISIRTLKERVDTLMKKYQLKMKACKGKSGIEIKTSENDDLLHQISELMEVHTMKKPKDSQKIPSEKSSFQRGYDKREEASFSFTDAPPADSEIEIENYTEPSTEVVENVKAVTTVKKPLAQLNINTPIRRRKESLKSNTIQYLTYKQEKNYDLQKTELALKERQLQLEENKFELDAFERKKRLELDERRVKFEERRVDNEEKRLKIHLDTFQNQQHLLNLVLNKGNVLNVSKE